MNILAIRDRKRSALLKVLVVVFSLCSAVSAAEVTIKCEYDPGSGKPNPLGLRAIITATEQDGTSTFVYERFPAPLPGDEAVTISVRRELAFHGVNIDKARALLRVNSNYYEELVGYPDAEGFGPFDNVMVCGE